MRINNGNGVTVHVLLFSLLWFDDDNDTDDNEDDNEDWSMPVRCFLSQRRDEAWFTNDDAVGFALLLFPCPAVTTNYSITIIVILLLFNFVL